MMLSRKGPIFVALITTTRKIFSVLISVFTSGYVLDQGQTFGIGIVIGGQVVESLYATFLKENSKKEALATDLSINGQAKNESDLNSDGSPLKSKKEK